MGGVGALVLALLRLQLHSEWARARELQGPQTGLLLPSGDNRLCGDGGNGREDTTSATCLGTTADGRLNIPLTEMKRRCEADTVCRGFGMNTQDGAYFRPVYWAEALNAGDAKWKSWHKSPVLS